MKILLAFCIIVGAYGQALDSSPRGLARVTFANLGTPADGTSTYCSDCTATNPTAGSGTGVVVRRENGAWNGGGGGSGTGSAIHFSSFSATPTWTATSNTGDTFCFQTTSGCDKALTASVTGITFTGGTAGEQINAVFIQASGCSSGGSGCFTVALPSGFDSCQIGQTTNAVTTMAWLWDGVTAHRISCTTTGPGQCPLTAAPGTPPSGQIFSWCDSTSKIPRVITDAGTILAYSKELTIGNIRVAGGANAADTGIATDTNTAHALCGGSPPAFGTSCTGGVINRCWWRVAPFWVGIHGGHFDPAKLRNDATGYRLSVHGLCAHRKALEF